MQFVVTSEAQRAEAVARAMKDFNFHILLGQINRAFTIVGLGIVVIFASMAWPTFYPFVPYLSSPHYITDVLRFWPLLLVAIGLNLSATLNGPALLKKRDEELLWSNILTSLGAGITEELWFRAVAPFYFMIGLVCMNTLTAQAPLVVQALAALFMIIIAGAFLTRQYVLGINPLAAILLFIAAGIAFNTATMFHGPNAFYAMVQQVFYPLTELISAGAMQSVLHGPYPWLLVMGMFFANFRFRDGHIYQGPIGWTNAWWFGCVMIFATLNYGIWVAITVHALFDMTVGVLQYVVQKFKPEPSRKPRLVVVDD